MTEHILFYLRMVPVDKQKYFKILSFHVAWVVVCLRLEQVFFKEMSSEVII